MGDYFVFKSHKWVRFSCFFFFFFFLFVCFVLCCFSFKNVQFPRHISRVRLIFFFVSPVGKVFCFLLFLFVCVYLILFCFVLYFVLLPTIPPPLISNGTPLSLFYYADHGEHYVIDNFEFPCNSVKNVIPI